VTASPLPPAALRALAEKYRRLLELRRARDLRGDDGQPGDAHTRRELRALAAVFPGCLRELDTAGEAGLSARHEAAQAGDGRHPTLVAVWHYHRLMAAALQIRAALLSSGTPRDPLNAGEIAAQVNGALAAKIDEAFVYAVARPPEGRLNAIVLRELGRRTGRTAAELAREIFPPRRRPRVD
jgi:hypothetical protein